MPPGHPPHRGSPVRHRLLPLACAAALAALPGRAADPPALSADRIQADLASLTATRFDRLGPGTRGDELTTDFPAEESKKAALAPAGADGTYFQPVPLLKVATSPQATLQAVKGGATLDIPPGD